jgi:hypothetical protein
MMQAQNLRSNFSRAMLVLFAFVALVKSAPAQSAADGESRTKTAARHYGYPIDWSSHYVVMTGDDPAAALAAGEKEPRHVYNLVRRRVAMENARRVALHPRKKARKKPLKIDWSVSLENGFVPPDQYPAKFQFNINAEDCNNDYIVFALTVNSGIQANLVGINNLYTGATPTPCNAGSPWVAFAYNTVSHATGQINTSPTLSLDGTKVAFVESTSGPAGAYFHVLVLPNPIPAPPSQTGTVLSPTTPSSCATPTVASCMTTLQISTATNTLSSVWVDYNTDNAYVGTDDGKLYKIHPVFGGGAPALVNDPTNWPVTVVASGTSNVLTDPIVDPTSGRIFIGDENGYLYAVNLTNPGQVTAATQGIGWIDHGPGTGVVDPPIVVNDISNPAINQVFAFTGCSSVGGIGGAITQLPANFASSSPVTDGTTVDLGSATGVGDCTTSDVHAGTFDNNFWLNGTASGHMVGCGFVNNDGTALQPHGRPQMYEFPFNSSHVITSTGSSTFIVNSTKGDECSPLSEFFDGANDRMFFGIGSTDGFIESSTFPASGPLPAPNCVGLPTSTCVAAPSALGGTSGIIVDNQLFGANGGANIYFSTLAPGSVNGGNCHVAGGTANPYCAVQLTQSGLQ